MFEYIRTELSLTICSIRINTIFIWKAHTYCYRKGLNVKYVTRFAKTRHNGAFLEIQIFASVSSIYLKLCSVAISMLYCKYFSSYKAR